MSNPKELDNKEGSVRASISVRLIRHAESENNEIYRDARRLFGGGTPHFDQEGWDTFVNTRRHADPGLSTRGKLQAEHLAAFLVAHLQNQASHPVRIVTSPMKRTLETIRPTLEQLVQAKNGENEVSKCHIIVNAFYHESEGCHIRDQAEEGMNPSEITSLLNNAVTKPTDLQFDGFPDASRGWYVNGTGAETRAEAETRAAKFYLWLCEYLDSVFVGEDVFDASVAVAGEEGECEHDLVSPRRRKRQTTLLVGHGDFMGLVLKRIVAGFGHCVENEGVPHRSAFVHYNTGITALEYFGNGRFLVMSSNQTPHFHPNHYSSLRSGGSLKDGWSYIVPDDEFLLDEEVAVAFEDELEQHVKEQTQALKALYLSSDTSMRISRSSSGLSVEEDNHNSNTTTRSSTDNSTTRHVSFIVKRGLQVVGCAFYNDETGTIKDVVIRPSARKSSVGKSLVEAVQKHAQSRGRSKSVVFEPSTEESKNLFEMLGFHELAHNDES